MISTLGIILIVVAVIVLWFIATYNSFIKNKNRLEEALADIDVQLKRRYDLIPNLINTVKGYASHEQETLQGITDARVAAMGVGTSDLQASAQAENALSATLKSLFAVSENYPDLKANANFLELQRELSDTEDKIQASRRFYNSMVRVFNTMCETFPSNIVGSMFGFVQRDLYDLDENAAQRENITVSF